jgi:hypothetical protein
VKTLRAGKDSVIWWSVEISDGPIIIKRNYELCVKVVITSNIQAKTQPRVTSHYVTVLYLMDIGCHLPGDNAAFVYNTEVTNAPLSKVYHTILFFEQSTTRWASATAAILSTHVLNTFRLRLIMDIVLERVLNNSVLYLLLTAYCNLS